MRFRRCLYVSAALLLVGPLFGHRAEAALGRARQAIWLGPGPFVLNSECLAPQEGPHPTPLPFSRSVLEDEMRTELLRLGVPLLATGVAQGLAKPLNFGSCVWREKDGQFEYRLSLSGPWPEDQLGDVEDVSYWPWQMGTVTADQLRSTLLRETRRFARAFVRSVRIGASPK
jgi:hypothetical protein